MDELLESAYVLGKLAASAEALVSLRDELAHLDMHTAEDLSPLCEQIEKVMACFLNRHRGLKELINSVPGDTLN